MTPEIQDVFQFVYKQAPFSELPEAAASYFSKHIEIVYLSQTNQQDWLQDGKPNLYLLRSGVVDLISAKDEVIGRMSEGDYFGYPSLLTGDAIQNRIEVQKDGLVYILNEQNFDFLRREYKPFEQYFVRAHANRLLSSRYKQQSETWSERKISELMTKDAVTIAPTASIREAAKLMSQHRVSSIMVTEQARLVGVVTDRDLRNRVLAQDKDPSAPLAEIMTEKPKHIFENNRVFSALHLMLKHNIHHLPVLNEAYKPLGMLTSTDLLRQQKSDPVQLIGRIYKAQNLLAIKNCAQEIPDLLRQFSYHIEDISLIGKLLSGLTDALTSRLIYLYQQQHGAAPCRFAWICFGSQAREEQTLHSDQDNGLLLPDNISENDRRYFAALGAFVCEQLNECGIQSCREISWLVMQIAVAQLPSGPPDLASGSCLLRQKRCLIARSTLICVLLMAPAISMRPCANLWIRSVETSCFMRQWRQTSTQTRYRSGSFNNLSWKKTRANISI